MAGSRPEPDGDVRAALRAAAESAPHPGPRLLRWQARVPELARHAADPALPETRAAQRVAAAVARSAWGQWRHPDGRRRVGAPVRGLAVAASAAVVLLALGGLDHATGPRHHAPVAAVGRVQLVALGAPTCPIAETRFDSPGGYHLCLPAGWTSHDYAGAQPDARAVETTGFDAPAGNAADLRPGVRGPDAAVLITVWDDFPDDIATYDHLASGIDTTVGGAPATAYDLATSDPGQARRVVLVGHGIRTYEIEQLRPGPITRADLDEVLRTFAFQGLPYFADPELRLTRDSA
jgi:hypothetical protein